ncbi:MAG: E2/UBC family protein [Opitutales bacterium]
MKDRVTEELDLLQQHWPELVYEEAGRWVLLPRYITPDTCVEHEVRLCFQIKPGHPGAAPYGFYVAQPITLEAGGQFGSTTSATEPPFEGKWLKFSWSPADWRPGATVRSGSNLVTWAHSFGERLAQGA